MQPSRPCHGKVKLIFRRRRYLTMRLVPLPADRPVLAKGQRTDIGNPHQDGISSDDGEVEPFGSTVSASPDDVSTSLV